MICSRRYWLAGVLFLVGCKDHNLPQPELPEINANVIARDVTFHSSALGRPMTYRVILPASIAPQQRLPTVYLLHGNGSDFGEWSLRSNVAQFAETGLILVRPQGDSSYYTNAAERSSDRYEDYIIHDLISEVKQKYPASEGRAIMGVSMGGFGAIRISLAHPELFTFAGALSPAIDAARRPFSFRRMQQSLALRSIFGPADSVARHDRDPFLLVRTMSMENAPYLFLSCGNSESLLEPNRQFATLLGDRKLPHEFHVGPGGHDWGQWNRQVEPLFTSLLQHLKLITSN